jgi:TIR domain
LAVKRVFLSWAHHDRALKEALLRDLVPALGAMRDVRVEWWEDSHLVCGEELLPGILDRLDEADYGLLLLSNRYLGSEFIKRHELPRFAGSAADKGSLPVLLDQLPGFGPSWDLGGVEHQVVFHLEGRSFAELRGARRTKFANRLADLIRRRLQGLDGYRTL